MKQASENGGPLLQILNRLLHLMLLLASLSTTLYSYAQPDRAFRVATVGQTFGSGLSVPSRISSVAK